MLKYSREALYKRAECSIDAFNPGMTVSARSLFRAYECVLIAGFTWLELTW